MSGDFSEPDRRGLAEWLHACGAVPERPDLSERPDVSDWPDLSDRSDLSERHDVLGRSGGSAYVVSFGWLPSRLPPSARGVESSIPAPRRAIEDLPRWDEPR
jgi:hypothetical protein